MLLLSWALFLAIDIVLALFLAVVISAALDPVVTWLEVKKIPRILSTLGIYIVALFMLALLVYLIVPIALTEFSNLIASLNESIGNGDLDFLNISKGIEVINQSLTNVSNLLLGGGRSFFEIISKFFGGLALTGSVFVLSFYLTVGRDGTEKFFINILPAIYENRAIELYNRIRRKLGRWLRGQLLLSLGIGVLVFIALSILNVKYSLVLAIIAAILELIPYVGPIFSGGVAILVASTTSLTLGLYVLIVFIVIQQLENQILVPAVTNLTTSLNPVVVLVALLMGAQIFGFIGLILAVPAAVLIQELLEDWAAANKKRSRGLGV